MITLNGNPVEIGSFPDGTILMKHNCTPIFVKDEAKLNPIPAFIPAWRDLT